MTRARHADRSASERPPPTPDGRVDALVDARNVLRSTWPNIPEGDLVAGVRSWARDHGVRAVVVFDGVAPGDVVGEATLDDGDVLVGTGRESADDWIARAAAGCRAARTPFWLVTSDRGLRARAGAGALRTIGGGTLARRITGAR